MKYKYRYILMFVLSFFLVGCQNKEVKTVIEEEPGNEMVISISSADSGKFHPLFTEDDGDERVVDLVYESLFDFSPEYEIEPVLAERYEVAKDKRSVKIFLKQGVLWHDGKHFTAEDVKYTFEMIAAPQYNGNLYMKLLGIEGIETYKKNENTQIEGIKILDDYTLQINTIYDAGLLIENIASTIPIFQKQSEENIFLMNKEKQDQLLTLPIGTGAYAFDNYKKSQSIRLVRNRAYWKGMAQIGSIRLKVLDKKISREILSQGKIDMIANDFSIETEQVLPNTQTIEYKNSKHTQVLLNFENAFLSQKQNRVALMHAIHRDRTMETVIKNVGSMVNYGFTYRRQVYFGHKEESAYPLMAPPQPTELKLIYSNHNDLMPLLAAVIQENLGAIHIKVLTEFVEMNAYEKRLQSGEYDMALMEYDQGDEIIELLYTQAMVYGNNDGSYSNEQMDCYIEQLYTNNKSEAVLEKIGDLIMEELPTLPLYSIDSKCLYSSRMINITKNNYKPFYNIHLWDIKED